MLHVPALYTSGMAVWPVPAYERAEVMIGVPCTLGLGLVALYVFDRSQGSNPGTHFLPLTLPDHSSWPTLDKKRVHVAGPVSSLVEVLDYLFAVDA